MLPEVYIMAFIGATKRYKAPGIGGFKWWSQRLIMEVAAMKKNGRPAAPRALQAKFWEGVRLGLGVAEAGAGCGGRPGEGFRVV
jgi:hypothetical protein